MSGNGGMRGFWAALTNHTDSKYEGAKASATLIVTRVEKDSSGGVLAAYGTLQGEGDTEFYMPLRGTSAGVGDHLLGTYPQSNPAGGELSYVRHVYSSDPAAGLLVPDAALPAPAWAAVPLTTALDASAGNISAYVVAYFLAVEARYQPSGYTVSYRAQGGEWADQPVPHLGGAQQARLAINFPPGTAVDVRLRARYNWAQVESLPSETRTIVAAVDDISPGVATGVTVEMDAPGGLNLFPAGTLDPAHFDHWQYEIATSAGGAGLVTRQGQAPYFFTGVSGNYYVAVRPVSKSGVLGGRYPGAVGTYAGPFLLNNPAAPIDTTPPPDWTAPTIALTRVTTNNNGEQAQLTITLPAYAYPTDYAETLAYVATNTNQSLPTQRIPNGTTSATLFVPFGTVEVRLRGLDKAGNLSANASPAATAALQPSGAPQAAPTLTMSTFALAIKLDWTAVPSALAYEVQRAPDVAGAPGTWATIATVDARMYLDTLATETIVLPTYWYRVRAINALGSGPYSAQALGTAGAVDAANLRLNSITAAQIAADAIATNHLQAGAITAGKLAADLVIASTIRTGNAGDRVEIHGQIAGDANANSIIMVANPNIVRAKLTGSQLRFNADNGVQRMILDGTGLTYYDPLGNWALRTGVAGSAGYLESAGGFTVRGDYTDLSMNAAQYMVWHWENYDNYDQSLYLTRARNPGLETGIGFLGARRNRVTGVYDCGPVIFAPTTYPTEPNQNYDATNYTAIKAGYIDGTGRANYPSYWFRNVASATISGNATTGTIDLTEVPVRITRNDGAAGKLMHSGVSGNFHQDWSHGGLYLGWFTNPGARVHIGNGAQAYGPIAASSFVVSSTVDAKQNIVDLGSVWGKLAQLRARRYELKSEPGVERIGFIAEEAAAIMPEVVTMLPAAPLAGPVAPEFLPQPTQAIDIYALVTVVAGGLAEAVPAAQATIAAQAKTIAGQSTTILSQGTKLGQAQARIAALETTVADLAARLAALEAKVV